MDFVSHSFQSPQNSAIVEGFATDAMLQKTRRCWRRRSATGRVLRCSWCRGGGVKESLVLDCRRC